MKRRRRIFYSAAQRSEIWDRWQAGEPMSSIGRRFDRESSSVFAVISFGLCDDLANRRLSSTSAVVKKIGPSLRRGRGRSGRVSPGEIPSYLNPQTRSGTVVPKHNVPRYSILTSILGCRDLLAAENHIRLGPVAGYGMARSAPIIKL